MHARVSLLVTVSLCHKSGRIFTGMSFNHKADVSQTEAGFLQQIECCSLWSNKTPWTSQKPTFDLKIIMSIQKVTLPGKSTNLLSRHDIWCIGAETTSSQINLWFYTHLMVSMFYFSYSNLSPLPIRCIWRHWPNISLIKAVIPHNAPSSQLLKAPLRGPSVMPWLLEYLEPL